MRDLVAVLVLAVPLLLLTTLVAFAIVYAWRQKRQDRRSIMAAGTAATAFVTKIGPTLRNGQCTVHFSFQPSCTDRIVSGTQRTTRAAVDLLGYTAGSNMQVHYLPKWPSRSFIGALTLAERGIPTGKMAFSSIPLSAAPTLFHVSYNDPATPGFRSSAANSFKWYGSGDVTILDGIVRFTALRHWRRGTIQRDFPIETIVNVEQVDATVRLQIIEGEKARRVQLWTVNAAQAGALAAMLPDRKTGSFVPALAERAAFTSTLLQVTPQAPVTPTLIAVNVFMFILAAALGGGLLVADPAVMIRLGTDYTPLTLGGQWWRLLTSTFLHFGFLHIALNMWALYVNGLVAERIFGSVRYIVIYLVAGLSGSIASLLWHPIVNGAGASGAIFGILGALLAFFLKRKGGVPASVMTAQRTSAGAFVVYSLMSGVRYRGIDNAAHLGGLLGGFVMGLILARPLGVERDSKPWTAQWTTALGVVGGAAVLFAYLFASGTLAPRSAHDEHGKPIPLDGLAAPIMSVGGFRLGMTADEVLRLKGPPIHQTESEWDYNSIDPRHDGVLSVEFSRRGQTYTGPVFAIEFFGNQESSPTELPYLNSLTTEEMIRKYGEPIFREPMVGGTTFLWFRNGVFVGVRNDKVYRYGIFNPDILRRRRSLT